MNSYELTMKMKNAVKFADENPYEAAAGLIAAGGMISLAGFAMQMGAPVITAGGAACGLGSAAAAINQKRNGNEPGAAKAWKWARGGTGVALVGLTMNLSGKVVEYAGYGVMVVGAGVAAFGAARDIRKHFAKGSRDVCDCPA